MKHRQQWLCGFLAQDFRGGASLEMARSSDGLSVGICMSLVQVPRNVAVAGNDRKEIPRNIKKKKMMKLSVRYF